MTNSAASFKPAIRSAPVGASEIIIVLSLATLAVVIIWWRWVGYQGHDDTAYAAAALSWVDHFPPLGANHWSLRYPLVLPIAAVIALFGPSIAALTIVNLAAFGAFLIVNYLAVRHWFGRGSAAIITLMSIVLPQFPVQATYANPDLPEMTLVIASFWSLMLARERGGTWRPLFVCGLLAGIGFLTRETSVLLVVLYGLLFLFRPAMPRWRYLFLALGFLLVVGGQAGYFMARTGDPFYRAKISAHHDTVDRAAKQTDAEAAGAALDSEGVVATNPLVAPLAALFISQKYGLLFFFAIPAYFLLRFSAWPEPRQRSVLDCAALGSLVAFLFVAVNDDLLYVVPRYFMVPAALAMVPVAVLAAEWFQLGGLRRVLAGLAISGFVVTSAGLLYLENTQPMLAEQRIAEFATSSGQIVHVDPETARRMRYLVLAGGLQDRVSFDPPPPGSLVATEDGVVKACLKAANCTYHQSIRAFIPAAGWVEVTRFDPPRRAISAVLMATGLDHFIPADIRHKIEQPGVAGIVYLTPR
jgi:4-amino-4-deoxy-L-arabinose transferase-like glycosyltransferase